MKCALRRERSAEGGSQEDPTGGHMNTPHTSLDRDVEGQAEDGELPRHAAEKLSEVQARRAQMIPQMQWGLGVRG